MITHVLSVSVSEKRATKFALQAPSMLDAESGSVTQLAPAALHNLAALISHVADIFPVTASLSVVAAHQIHTFPELFSATTLFHPVVALSFVFLK